MDEVQQIQPHEAAPTKMEAGYLVELAFQVYARACHPACSEGLHNRAQELTAEVLRRVMAADSAAAVGALVDRWQFMPNDTKGALREAHPELTERLDALMSVVTADS